MEPLVITAVHSQGFLGQTGSLRVDSTGLYFVPMNTNLKNERDPITIPYDDVISVGLAPRKFFPPRFNGQYFRRLKVESSRTGIHYFAARNPRAVVTAVRSLWGLSINK